MENIWNHFCEVSNSIDNYLVGLRGMGCWLVQENWTRSQTHGSAGNGILEREGTSEGSLSRFTNCSNFLSCSLAGGYGIWVSAVPKVSILTLQGHSLIAFLACSFSYWLQIFFHMTLSPRIEFFFYIVTLKYLKLCFNFFVFYHGKFQTCKSWDNYKMSSWAHYPA